MRRAHAVAKDCSSPIRTQEYQEANVPILGEILFAAELVLLHAAPLYYGLGIPHGDGSAVILLPAFLCPDAYLTPLHQWLARIGYKPFFSGIGFNNECPNLLIKRQLNATIEKALAKSGRKVHLVGHSLGGIIARAIAAQRPSDVASVITLGAPFRGTVAHSSILHAAEMVRRRIHAKHGSGVLPDCYTGHCTCDIARQTAPNPTSQSPERISGWYLTHPSTVSLLSAWLRHASREHDSRRVYNPATRFREITQGQGADFGSS